MIIKLITTVMTFQKQTSEKCQKVQKPVTYVSIVKTIKLINQTLNQMVI